MGNEKLALSFAVGVMGGLFPLPGTTTLACIALAFVLPVNFAAVQVVNMLLTPLNLACFIPFIRLGDLLLRSQTLPDTASDIVDDLRAAFFASLWKYAGAIVHGMIAWTIVLAPCIFLLYRALLLPLLNAFRKRPACERDVEK